MNGRAYRRFFVVSKILIDFKRGVIVRHVSRHRQVIAGRAAYAAARLTLTDIHLFCPRRIRETVEQALAVLLLIRFAVLHICFTAMVAGTDAVMAVGRILRRQVAVVTQHLTQFAQLGGGRNMAHLAADRINRQ
ncbi:Uncharacterised protein [Enterobacter hormaechei]|nr:Uncharacterised protein [Enterobacter hormaechei]